MKIDLRHVALVLVLDTHTAPFCFQKGTDQAKAKAKV